MILQQIRSQGIWGNLGKVLVISSVASLLVVNFLTFLLVEKRGGGSDVAPVAVLQVLFLIMGAGAMIDGGGLKRSPDWWVGLPLEGRRIWLAHALTLAAAGVLVVLFQGLVSSLFGALLTVLIKKPVFTPREMAAICLPATAVTVLVAATLASIQPGRVDLGGVRDWPRIRAVTLVVAVALVFALSLVPPWFSVLPVVAAALLSARTYARLDSSLVFDVDRPGVHPGPAAVGAASLTVSRGFTLPGPWVPVRVLDQLFKIRYRWIILVQGLTAVFGAQMSGAVWTDGSALDVVRSTTGILMIYLLFAFSGEFVQRLHLVDALPVGRGGLLAAVALPGIIALTLGYAGGAGWLAAREAHVEAVGFQHRYGVFGPVVPPGYSEILQLNDAEPLTAPSGETHALVARHGIPLPGAPWAARPPFMVTVPEGDPLPSPDYLAWQIAGAAELVYGVRLPEEEIARRYVRADEQGNATVVDGGPTLARDFDLEALPLGPVFPLLAGPVFLGYLACLALYFRFFAVLRSKRQGRVLFWTVMGSLLTLHLLRVMGVWPMPNAYAGAVLVFRPALKLQTMGPGGHVLAYGVMLVLLAAAWRWALHSLRKVQAPLR
ncbi:hypothetical protein KJ682_07760 [bacterium]|nr:hypothetical protein [bacterium]